MPYSSLYFKSKWSFPSSLSEQPAMEIRGKMAAKNLTTIFLNPIALPVFQTTIESTRQEHGNPILWFCTSMPALLPPTHFRGDFAFKWYDYRTIVMKNKLSCQSFAQRKPDLKNEIITRVTIWGKGRKGGGGAPERRRIHCTRRRIYYTFCVLNLPEHSLLMFFVSNNVLCWYAGWSLDKF